MKIYEITDSDGNVISAEQLSIKQLLTEIQRVNSFIGLMESGTTSNEEATKELNDVLDTLIQTYSDKVAELEDEK